MHCSDDEQTLMERNGNVNEQLRDIDEELVEITESIVDDIEPMVSSNGATIVLPSIVTSSVSDDVKPLITSMRVTRIGAVSPLAVLQTSVSPLNHQTMPTVKGAMLSTAIASNDRNNLAQLSSESDPFGEHNDDEMDNIYDETPELDDLDHCLRITQPIWHLPHVDRATVVHYLQSKPVGVFIVSSTKDKLSTIKSHLSTIPSEHNSNIALHITPYNCTLLNILNILTILIHFHCLSSVRDTFPSRVS